MNKNIEYIVVDIELGYPTSLTLEIGSIMRWNERFEAFITKKGGGITGMHGKDPAKEPEFYEAYNTTKRMVLSEKMKKS